MKVTNLQVWPNRLGFNATVNGVQFEISHDPKLKRLAAWRLRSGEMTHFFKLGEYSQLVKGNERIAEVIGMLWRDRREDWIAD